MSGSGDGLLDRNEFRKKVLDRDSHLCVVCELAATAVHHILDRKLFSDGGYYINNGASLCDDCHWNAEKTLLSCYEIREAAKIDEVVLPDKYNPTMEYDKWGNIVLPNGKRLQGEMFFDDAVQKIFRRAGLLNLFY